MAKYCSKRPETPYRPRRSQRFNPISAEPNPGILNRNFPLREHARTESVPAPPKSGSLQLVPADRNTSNEIVNGKQWLRRAAAAVTVRGVEESVRKPSLEVKKNTNHRNNTNSTGKYKKKQRKATQSTYFINTRGTHRSEIAIVCANSVSSYYAQIISEDLVVPKKDRKQKTPDKTPKTNHNTKLLCNKTVTRVTKSNRRTERLKVAKRQKRKRSDSSTSYYDDNNNHPLIKRVLFESIPANEARTRGESSTTLDEIGGDDSEEEAEHEVPLVPRKSFFERSVEEFCEVHTAFENATERCLNRLRLARSVANSNTITPSPPKFTLLPLFQSMNSPASPRTPAVPMVTQQAGVYHSHLSPTTEVLLANHQLQQPPHSGKRKHSDDITDHHPHHHHTATTPPGHHSTKYLHPQQQQPPNGPANASSAANQYHVSPRSWIFQTPDKQKLGKLLGTLRDDVEDDIVPVLLHHSKRLKTVYSFDESTVADLVQGGGASGVGEGGGAIEVQIDSDRLAQIIQMRTADDGADCEFETNSISTSMNISSSRVSSTTSATNCLVSDELNQFQLQTHELSLNFDFDASSDDVVGDEKQWRTGERGGGDGDGEGAFLDQWVRMNGGSGDHSPLRLLQTHLSSSPSATTSRYFPTSSKPASSNSVNQHLRTIHNVATQRPTKTLSRFDRRQYFERKSLTFDEVCSPAPDAGASPTVGECAVTAAPSGRLRALKQKAASADSISGGSTGEGTSSGRRKRNMDLFNIGRGETIHDLNHISETITSGAYERELSELSGDQENMPPSHMRLLLGNLQMNDSVDINYEPPLFPRRNY